MRGAGALGRVISRPRDRFYSSSTRLFVVMCRPRWCVMSLGERPPVCVLPEGGEAPGGARTRGEAFARCVMIEINEDYDASGKAIKQMKACQALAGAPFPLPRL